jgi:hypothetical protein
MGTGLLHRYEEEWNALLRNQSAKSVGGEEPTNPLLLNVPSAYCSADYRVMIFGQETNDWWGIFPHDGGVDHMLKCLPEVLHRRRVLFLRRTILERSVEAY